MRGKYFSKSRKWIVLTTLAFSSLELGNSYINKPYYTTNDLNCLAKNIYYEARGESYKGQLYVAYTTISRTLDNRFPNSICAVVYQRYQFSWTLTKNSKPIGEAWDRAKIIAHIAFNSYNPNKHNVQYFHSVKIRPAWSVNKRVKIKIGNHIFYYDTGRN